MSRQRLRLSTLSAHAESALHLVLGDSRIELTEELLTRIAIISSNQSVVRDSMHGSIGIQLSANYAGHILQSCFWANLSRGCS